MADKEQVDRLKDGVKSWNDWRREDSWASIIGIDLSYADLQGLNLYQFSLDGACLEGANLKGVNLCEANLCIANLWGANLREAKLREANLVRASLCTADLSYADLTEANLEGADLHRATLFRADLSRAELSNADLIGADLQYATLREAFLNRAILIETNLSNADISGAFVHGVSAWDLNLTNAIQNDIVITPPGESEITLDNIELAQFVYLLLNNRKIREVIDTITSKCVLILGRFTPERKFILDAIRQELRNNNYLPILFDFFKPASRDITETISTLAHMSRFIIADITDARSIPQELMRIVPSLPSVPVQPILLSGHYEYGMFEHFKRFPWVLEVVLYDDLESLLYMIKDRIIIPAERGLRNV